MPDIPVSTKISYLNIVTISVAPRITLSFGANIDQTNLVAGNDVYLECHIEANPDVYKVEWRKDVSRFPNQMFRYQASILTFTWSEQWKVWGGESCFIKRDISGQVPFKIPAVGRHIND